MRGGGADATFSCRPDWLIKLHLGELIIGMTQEN